MLGFQRSPSSRRAWIEIVYFVHFLCYISVALLAEGVDRNIDVLPTLAALPVALLAEGVDRNVLPSIRQLNCCFVALLAEGVDRNSSNSAKRAFLEESPSSRRAWIEI